MDAGMWYAAACALAMLVSMGLGAAVMGRVMRRRMARTVVQQDTRCALALEEAVRENASLQSDLDRLQAELEQVRTMYAEAMEAAQRQGQDWMAQSLAERQSWRMPALEHAQEQGKALQELQGIGKTFERWHADMSALVQHNRTMHEKNDEFGRIVRQMVIVALNASIEAARAGAQGRGFTVVAGEMRDLSARAEALSNDYRTSLYENDLIATTTFQDMQAGGKMVINAALGLQLTNGRIHTALAA